MTIETLKLHVQVAHKKTPCLLIHSKTYRRLTEKVLANPFSIFNFVSAALSTKLNNAR